MDKDSNEKYIPGVCNIGKAELNRRKNNMILSFVVFIASAAALLFFVSNPIIRLLIFFPAAYAAVSFQQVYFKFCVNFGIRGVFNFGDPGKTYSAEQQEFYKKDRAKAMQMLISSIGFAAFLAAGFYFI